MKNLFIDSKFIVNTYKEFKIITHNKANNIILKNIIDNFSKKNKIYYGRGDVFKIDDFIIRKYRHGGIFRNILKDNFLSINRFKNEFKIYLYLQNYNFPTLTAVGLILHVSNVIKKAYLITEELKNSIELSKIIDKKEIFFKAGKTVKLLHECHVVHGDLHLKNLLYNIFEKKVYIIDFDKSFFSEREDLKLKDIKRFMRSISKYNYFNKELINKDTIESFLSGYEKEVDFTPNILNKISWLLNKPNF